MYDFLVSSSKRVLKAKSTHTPPSRPSRTFENSHYFHDCLDGTTQNPYVAGVEKDISLRLLELNLGRIAMGLSQIGHPVNSWLSQMGHSVNSWLMAESKKSKLDLYIYIYNKIKSNFHYTLKEMNFQY